MSVSAARSRIIWASEDVEKGRFDGTDVKLDEAERFLAGLPDDETMPLRAEIAELRSRIET